MTDRLARAGGPAAWIGERIADDPAWVVHCPERITSDLLRAVELVEGHIDEPGGSVDAAADSLGPTRDWSPTLADLADGIRSDLFGGRGFALLRGLPVDDLTATGRRIVCWLVSAAVGTPIHQNAARDKIVRVADDGKDFAEIGVRSYETNAALDYHSDSSDVVALYCVRPAMEGGTSTIVSAVAVHDAVVQIRPDLAPLLYEDWPQASPVDLQVHRTPICARRESGKLFTRYGRHYIDTAADYDSSVGSLSAAQVELLDVYDSFLHDPRFALDMSFRPGDIQFLDNYSVMHARTGYVDWPEPMRRRELLRMWLVLADLDLPDAFADSGFIPRSQVFANPSSPTSRNTP